MILEHFSGVLFNRWVQRYAPELEKRVRWYQGYRSSSWRVDETYVRVGGMWKFLFRAVDKQGRLIDFMLSDRRNTKAARRFLAKALKVMRNWPPVERHVVDGDAAFAHHFLKVPVADAVAAIPADTEQDDLGQKPAGGA